MKRTPHRGKGHITDAAPVKTPKSMSHDDCRQCGGEQVLRKVRFSGGTKPVDVGPHKDTLCRVEKNVAVKQKCGGLELGGNRAGGHLTAGGVLLIGRGHMKGSKLALHAGQDVKLVKQTQRLKSSGEGARGKSLGPFQSRASHA